MKVNGIVAEYNPFHNGHAYQMKHAKEATGADYTIIVMSGNFMQRGAPALLDKFTRVKMALECGADLVLELPTCCRIERGIFRQKDPLLCSTSWESPRIYALAVNAVTSIRSPGLPRYSTRSRNLMWNPCAAISKRECPSRIARTWALLQYAPSLSNDKDVLSSPNNILGIEYLKALMSRNSKIVPFTTTRVGADYHDKRLGTNQCSAIAIRQSVAAGHDLTYLASQMPENAYEILRTFLKEQKPLFADDFSAMAAIQVIDRILRGLRQVSGYFLRSLRPYPQYPAVLHRLIFFLRSAQEQGYDLHPYQQMPVPYFAEYDQERIRDLQV